MKPRAGVSLRGGEEGDIPFVRKKAGEWRLDDERIEAGSLLVAQDPEGNILGFGRIKEYPGCRELGMVGVVPQRRGEGIGGALVRALIERSPSREIWITTDLPDYFRRFGFQEVEKGPRELHEKIATNCRCLDRGNVRIMLLRRERHG